MKEVFNSKKGYRGKGVSQVTMYNGLGHFSGQISCDLATGTALHDSMTHQTTRVIQSIQAIMEDLNLSLDNITKCNVYISSMDLFDEMNDVYISFFGTDNPPARQTVAVGIWDGLDVEISGEFTY